MKKVGLLVRRVKVRVVTILPRSPVDYLTDGSLVNVFITNSSLDFKSRLLRRVADNICDALIRQGKRLWLKVINQIVDHSVQLRIRVDVIKLLAFSKGVPIWM